MLEPFGNRGRFEAELGLEMMTRNNGDIQDGLASEIRRQFGSEAIKRFARSMPTFRAETDIPDHLRDLLDELEGVETSPAGDRRSR
ncbi:hypothetical protein [uncultured Mesorhizobium sp.]|uniref:hypothetical protein n=3 Tax=Mesorhizobium TaxID=68287 RepID=UPI00344728B1